MWCVCVVVGMGAGWQAGRQAGGWLAGRLLILFLYSACLLTSLVGCGVADRAGDFGRKIKLFADGHSTGRCGVLFKYLYYQVAHLRLFDEIELYYSMAGHSHDYLDQASHLVLAWLNYTCLSSTRLGLAWLGSARLGLA